MRDKLIMVVIPLCCMFFLPMFIIFNDTLEVLSLLNVTISLFFTFFVFCTLSLLYSLHMCRKYDNDNMYMLYISWLQIFFIPFYYIRLKRIKNKQDNKYKLLPRRKNRLINNFIVKTTLVLTTPCTVYYTLVPLLFFTDYRDTLISMYYPINILSIILLTYSIYCWHIVDHKSKYLFLLIMFNLFYMPFYSRRVLRIIKIKQKQTPKEV